MSDTEWQTRLELAAAFRLAVLEGWDDLGMGHMSARVPGTTDEFLFLPAELTFEEITASSLQKIDGEGRLLHPSPYPPHKFSYALHMPTYRRIPPAACIIHVHSKYPTAVSMQQHGLLPAGQYALWLGPVAYADYEGHFATLEEGEHLAKALGSSKVLLMRHHGTFIWGETIAQAFLLTWILNRACENQILALSGGATIAPVRQDVIDRTPEQARSITSVDGLFGLRNWQAQLRRVERLAPDYKT